MKVTKDGNVTQNERLMVYVRVRPVEPFREVPRAIAVLDNQTLLFSEPSPASNNTTVNAVAEAAEHHHFRSGTLFSSGTTTTTGSNSTAPSRSRTNLNHQHSQSLSNIPNNYGHHQNLHQPHQTTASKSNPNSTIETGKAYDFDHVFDETATQEEVYKNTAAPLVRSVMEGFCATVFAYGATGSGKTYTMIGTPTNPGIMARAVDDIFHLCANQKRDIKTEVYLSYLEVYNEQIRDLLRPTPGIHLDLREDKDQVHVAGLSEIRATSTHEVLNLLQKGNKARTMEATGANITSSRSHAVLQVSVRQVSSRTGVITEGKLYLIDLAGSERASNTKNSGVRLREGGHINRSLLALGNCITALASGDSDKYINYRDSKLTRLLKAALGGPSKTAMIAHVNPGTQQREETRNTLLYAQRARAISNRVRKFTYQGQATDTNQVIQDLRNEVKRLQLKLDQQNLGGAAEPGSSETVVLESHPQAYAPPVRRSTYSRPPAGRGSNVSRPATISRPQPVARTAMVATPPSPPIEMRTSTPKDFVTLSSGSTGQLMDRPDLSKLKQEIVTLFEEEFRLRNDLLKLDGAMLQSALDCEILRLMVLDWETLKIRRDSDGEATSDDSDPGKTEISSVMAELRQVREEQDRLLQMRTQVENELKLVRDKISQTEDDANQFLPDSQREILSLLCKLQQDQVGKMSVEIESELKRRGSLLLRCLRQKALGEAIIHRQRHFLNAIAGNSHAPSRTADTGISSGGSGHSQAFLPPLQKQATSERLFTTPSSNIRTPRSHLPPLSGIPRTTKYSEFRRSRLQQRRQSSSDEEIEIVKPNTASTNQPRTTTTTTNTTTNSSRRNRATSPDLRYKAPY